jgi:hypothetical protein
MDLHALCYAGQFCGWRRDSVLVDHQRLGFNLMQTTLLNIPGGACQVISITFWMWMLHKYPVSSNTPISLWIYDY